MIKVLSVALAVFVEASDKSNRQFVELLLKFPFGLFVQVVSSDIKAISDVTWLLPNA